MADLLTHLLDHLEAAGVVRRPDTAGPLPPLWRDPAAGAPAPGERKGTVNDDVTVLTASLTGEIPRVPMTGGYSDRRIVDIRIRTKRAPASRELDAAIKAELAPAPLGVRYDWTMAGLYLVESRQWRPLQLLGSSEAQGFDYVVAYLFESLPA